MMQPMRRAAPVADQRVLNSADLHIVDSNKVHHLASVHPNGSDHQILPTHKSHTLQGCSYIHHWTK
jgi:hypothetical protein